MGDEGLWLEMLGELMNVTDHDILPIDPLAIAVGLTIIVSRGISFLSLFSETCGHKESSSIVYGRLGPATEARYALVSP